MERTDLVWVRLSDMFGDRFINTQGKEPTQVWLKLVSRLSNQQIRRALLNIEDEYKHRKSKGLPTYPPNYMDFDHAANSSRRDDPPQLPNPHAISAGVAGTARFYGIDCSGLTEDQVNHLIWEASMRRRGFTVTNGVVS